ncbi:hypothetical protein L1987_06593 [Smallanthus sonchifolius]|uniref:Uncharacterized protein n=1 Tax=Smallanthus sonchifolius TaxID=185202 RepID=A0ACB9JYK4_9ASTR|nr:hypothetical protein L1987_06593 [Smallanthus sonchifolius]
MVRKMKCSRCYVCLKKGHAYWNCPAMVKDQRLKQNRGKSNEDVGVQEESSEQGRTVDGQKWFKETDVVARINCSIPLDQAFRRLIGLKNTFARQLPNMPKECIVRLVIGRYNMLRRNFPVTSFTGSPVLFDAGFDLLNKFLTYDPEKRITAEAALNHGWFREVPLPKPKDFMPTFSAQHAQDRRTQRVMKSPDPLEEQRRKELQQAEFGTCGLFR